MDKTHVTVRIAGQEFKLTGSGSEDYIQKLAACVNKKIDEVQNTYPNVSTGNCVMLAALNLADELHQLQADYDALDSRISALRDMPRSTAPASPVKRPFEAKEPVSTK